MFKEGLEMLYSELINHFFDTLFIPASGDHHIDLEYVFEMFDEYVDYQGYRRIPRNYFTQLLRAMGFVFDSYGRLWNFEYNVDAEAWEL